MIDLPEMVLIPAGEFLMGSDPRRDPCAGEREQPQHRLYLPDYTLSKTPVTNAQFAAFVTATGHMAPAHWTGGWPPPDKADHPVVHVSWHDALAYCRWLMEKWLVASEKWRVSSFVFRLPTEAEWEKGARGLDGRLYPWGDGWDATCCNAKESGADDTTPVGAYPGGASPYGLLDMAGNVWEWTASQWGKDMKEAEFGYPYNRSDGREALEVGNGVLRVLRGGAFYYNAAYARAACRLRSYPDYRVRTRGFRVCGGEDGK